MMCRKYKKSSTESVPVDIISNLPGEVIDAILVRLPLCDAVRTSILSKKWRCKWRTLPELTLCETVLETTNDRIRSTVKFTNIFYQILTLHSGPVTKFSICIPYGQKCPHIDNLMYFLSMNGIQYLVLKLRDDYKLPSSTFTCSQMRHLTLHSCSIQLPPPAFRFDWLINLELYKVNNSSTCLESLISCCPLLEQLKLVLQDFDISRVEVNAPMLRSFAFTGNLIYSCLKNSPLLEKLFLRHWVIHEEKRECDIAMFFESFSALELLYLENDCLKFLAAGRGDVPTRLPFDLNCLKHLSFNAIYFRELDTVSCALCLIRSSSNLQYIEIKVSHGPDFWNDPAVESLEVEGFSDVSFSHLKEVKLIRIVGSQPEMQLMKLLLAKSPMLVRMQIELYLEKDHESLYKVFGVFAELNSFARASPKAKVVTIVYWTDGSTLTFG